MPAELTPVLPPGAPSDWEELARLVRVYTDADALAADYSTRAAPDFSAREYQRLCKSAVAARVAFADYATPERIARLLAVAQHGAEDSADLDWIEQRVGQNEGLILQAWILDGRRFVPRDSGGWPCLLVHKFADRGGADESVREAIRAVRRASPDTTRPGSFATVICTNSPMPANPMQEPEDRTPAEELAQERARRVAAEKLNQDAAMTLAFGIDGTMDREAAYTEAFAALYGNCFGPAEATRILAEGSRHAAD